MKKTIFTLTLVLGLSTVLFTSCGNDEDTKTIPTPTAKTLDKSELVDKGWYKKGGSSPTHTFHSDGKYNSLGGTWSWLNDSDSMELTQSTGLKSVLYFSYCTDTEMAFRSNSKTSAEAVYKSTFW